jgi:hypothetical protein
VADVLGPLDPKQLYRAIENAVVGGWTREQLLAWAAARDITVAELQTMLRGIVSNPAGRSQMASMAKTLLARMAAAEGAAVVGTATGAAAAGAEIGTAAAAGGAGAGGGSAAGGTFLGLGFGAWFAIAVVVLAAGAYYIRSYSTSSSSKTVPYPGTSPVAVAVGTCTRGRTVPDEGSAVRVKYNKPTYTFTYIDPASRASNQIQWNIPPENITRGEQITLVSWSTHNQGAPVYVEWEVNNTKAPGALSDRIEPDPPNKQNFTYQGGPIKLIGGRQLGGSDTTFKIQWEYTCQ